MWNCNVTEECSFTRKMDIDHEQREYIEKNFPELLDKKYAQIGFRLNKFFP